MSRLIKKKRFSKKESEVVGCVGNKRKTTALIDTGDVHALMIGAAGVGKNGILALFEYAFKLVARLTLESLIEDN